MGYSVVRTSNNPHPSPSDCGPEFPLARLIARRLRRDPGECCVATRRLGEPAGLENAATKNRHHTQATGGMGRHTAQEAAHTKNTMPPRTWVPERLDQRRDQSREVEGSHFSHFRNGRRGTRSQGVQKRAGVVGRMARCSRPQRDRLAPGTLPH